MRCMGIDPGFGTSGVATIVQTEKGYHCIGVAVIEIKKGDDPKMRITRDDHRRLREFVAFLGDVDKRMGSGIVAYEEYIPRKGKGGGNALKTVRFCGAIVAWAEARGITSYTFVADDLKRNFCGNRKASKADVEAALCLRISGLQQALSGIKKDNREHCADAAGHALLGLALHRQQQLLQGEAWKR